MKKQSIHYASLKMLHSASVMGSNLYQFKDQYGQQLVVQSGDQFRQLLRTIQVAQRQQGGQDETQ